MEETKEIYKRCPTKGCRTISGFSLPISEIKKDKKYFCPFCQKKHKLSKWIPSTRESYEVQNDLRDGSKPYGGKGLKATAF